MATIRVGLDFDNTLINYDHVFYQAALTKKWIVEDKFPSKSKVKQSLIDQDGNDIRWQHLQAEVYGPEILKASFFAGVDEFFSTLKNTEVEFFIVSHKSKVSHIRPDINLRDSALLWIKHNNLFSFIKQENIYFAETREEKVKKIAELKCDFFVDDLLEVFHEPHFPQSCFQVYFNHNAYFDWTKITQVVLSSTILGLTWTRLIYKNLNALALDVAVIKRDGNNRIFSFSTNAGQSFILKSYMKADGKMSDRGQKEFESHKLLYNEGVREIARSYFFDVSEQIALYSFLPGTIATQVEWCDQLQKKVCDFLNRLDAIYIKDRTQLDTATDSRKCLKDYQSHIERRMKLIKQGIDSDPSLERFKTIYETELTPLKEKIIQKFYSEVKRLHFDLEKPFHAAELTFSPSDFGLHNMKVFKNDVFFYDFEYFGVDDVAKLIADFYHHVGFVLDDRYKQQLFAEMKKARVRDVNFADRFALIFDLIGLEWVLIVLNVCHEGVIARRLFANPDLNLETLLQTRYDNAKLMIKKLQGN